MVRRMLTTVRRTRQPAIALLALALLAACAPREEPAETPPPEPAAAPAPVPTLPLPPPPLGRTDVLDAVAAAAASFAAGAAYPEATAALAGRRFRLSLPFGCAGPTPGESRAGYVFDAEKRTLRLTARTEVWTDTAWAERLANGTEVEAVEGFWIRRPWLRTETCPAVTPIDPEAAAPPAPDTVGVAQVFEAGGSRLLRRANRPYEATRKVEEGQMPGAGGFRLVLEGEVAKAEGRPVRCHTAHPDQRPACLLLVSFQRVAFETSTGETLAEWKN